MQRSVFHPEQISVWSALSGICRPVHLTPSSPGMMDALVPRQDECVEEKILHSSKPNKRPVIPAGHSRTAADMSSSTLDFWFNQASAWALRWSPGVWGAFWGQRWLQLSENHLNISLIWAFWSWHANGWFPKSFGLRQIPVSLGALRKEKINVTTSSG